LGQINAPQAPGYDEYLMRVTIQPGAKLASHRHPGTQIARIEQGELTYTIESGVAEVARNGASAPSEQVTSGDVVLRPGDTVYENPELIHHAENRGGQPVIVHLGALLQTGQPVAINT
jgi:quercetin dioxygenase-like cupin family protein